MGNISLSLFKVHTDDLEDIRNGLIALCEYDCDMNGENGEDYLWEEAAGYESNAEYLAAQAISKCETAREMFMYFVDTWMDADRNYYSGYSINFLEDKGELTVAFTTVHEY